MDGMIGLCGSHMTSIEKMSLFQLMVKSWHNNSVVIPLYVSMSCDTKIYDNIRRRIEIMELLYPELKIFLSNHPLSQFEHYKLLSEKVIEIYGPDIFILFTDDDDLWNTSRVKVYSECIIQMDEQIQNISSFKSSSYADSTILNNGCTAGPNSIIKEINSPKDVDINLQSGFIQITSSIDTYGEYWEYCVQLKYLQEFISKASIDILRNKYCDLCFVKFIRLYDLDNKIIAIIKNDDWLYFHRYLHIRSVNPVSCHDKEKIRIALKYIDKISHDIRVDTIRIMLLNDLQVIACRSRSVDDAIKLLKSSDNAVFTIDSNLSLCRDIFERTKSIRSLIDSPSYK